VLGFLPNLFAAALIAGVGWFIARILQQITSNLLAALGMDQLSENVGLTAVLGKQRLSGVVGLIVYILILIPVLVAALNALQLDAITEPASNMLDAILAAIPLVFAAALLLVIAYVVGRVVAGLIANLLGSIGFDRILALVGYSEDDAPGRGPSDIAGYLVQVAILLFASIEASRLLGFSVLADLVAQFLVFSGQVLLGLVIFAIGLYLSNLAATVIQASENDQAKLLSLVARISIIVLAGTMALSQMNIAGDIINLAFGIVLGSVALALALAFGFGGREVAARQLEEWKRKWDGQ
jgi:sulfur transfer protein SufE